ncbi:hypothetical protein ABZR86_06855 [Dyella marensis]|uniref:hypothetical protein n=1 Tax=Dyella TaxID=231454 RepID=UPI0011609EA9|nr:MULTISPECIES: hypothetical protein [Dyella]
MQTSGRKRDKDDYILRLPSLESQFAAWVCAVDRNLASRNLTLKRAGFRAYVRRSYRKLDGIPVVTLDIASISIPERFRGRGWFRQFRQIVEAMNPWNATYYESVHNPQLASYFRSEGLSRDGSCSFYVMHSLTPGWAEPTSLSLHEDSPIPVDQRAAL